MQRKMFLYIEQGEDDNLHQQLICSRKRLFPRRGILLFFLIILCVLTIYFLTYLFHVYCFDVIFLVIYTYLYEIAKKYLCDFLGKEMWISIFICCWSICTNSFLYFSEPFFLVINLYWHLYGTKLAMKSFWFWYWFNVFLQEQKTKRSRLWYDISK